MADTVNVAESPGSFVWDADPLRVKAAEGAGVTTSFTVAGGEVIDPLAPLIVRVRPGVPVGAMLEVSTARVEEVDPLTIGFGLKEAFALDGRPLTLKATASAKPLLAVSVMAKLAICP